MNALTAFWSQRSEQEKTLIGALGVVVALALIFAILVEPALSGRARNTHELAVLRGQLGVMELQANEARRLASIGQGTTLTGEPLRNALADLARQHGLTGLQINANGVGVRAQASGVSFADWVEWLDEARRQFRVRVTEAHVVAVKDGHVDTQVLLDPS